MLLTNNLILLVDITKKLTILTKRYIYYNSVLPLDRLSENMWLLIKKV